MGYARSVSFLHVMLRAVDWDFPPIQLPRAVVSNQGVGFVPDVSTAPPKILRRASRAITSDTSFQ